MSYPNQKKITIHKPKYDDKYVEENGAFMQLGLEEWQEAFKKYCKGNKEKTSVLGLYLYLASNANGFEKWISPSAYEKATGKSRASYYRAFAILEEDGYIYKDAGGCLNFATTPQKSSEIVCHDWEKDVSKVRQSDLKDETDESQECDSAVSQVNIEINNINNHKKEQIIIDKGKKASPSSASSLDYLKEIVAPNGEYIGGDKKGQWLEDQVPNLWGLSRLARIEAISANTDFAKEEAHIISYSILDWRNRKRSLRAEVDFDKDIFYCGE